MVKKIIQNSMKSGSSLLFNRQRSILTGAIVIGVMLFASALLGLVKNRLYASVITPGPELDVFFAAFRLPDLIFQLVIGGALNAAYIPVFSHIISTRDKGKSWDFVSWVINIVMIFFIAISVLMFLFARPLTVFIGVGFSPAETDLLVEVLRILLIAPALLGVSSFIAGTLQSFQRFFLPFLSPVFYNLGAIFGIIFLYPVYGVKGAAWGVVIGAFAHLLIQFPALIHLGYSYRFSISLKDRDIRAMFKLSIPRTFGAGIEQVKALVLVNIASFLPRGSISFFDLGRSIINLPISIIGISVAQASLPQFASLYAKDQISQLRTTFASSFNQIMFFIMPVSVALIILKIPAVRLIYGAGEFSWDDTVLTSWVVAAFGVGISVQALNALMVRVFYAMQETKVPVILSVAGMVVSIAFAFLGVRYASEYGVTMLALSVTVGAAVEFALLVAFLVRHKIIISTQFLETPVKIMIASFIAGVTIYVPVKYLDSVFIDTTRVVNLVILVWLVIFFGSTTYLITTWLLGVDELKVVFRILVKVRSFRENLIKSFRSPQIMSTPVIDETSD